MTLSMNALEALRNHWAVSAIGVDDLERAERLVHEHLARRAVGKQIAFSFTSCKDDDALLERVALAYEMAAIEGLDELSRPAGENVALRDQATAASFRAFDIRRLLPVPTETHDRIFFVLQLSAIAYCGDRWSDLRRWYKENAEALRAPSVAETPWDRRLLYRLFHCWVRLFRKDGWDDLDRIREIIAGLRDDQKTFEEARLQNGSHAKDRAIALRLAALYHWAKGTELVAHYMLQGQPANPFGSIDKHFDGAIKAATASGDAQHEIILRWLHATARIMITNSLWWATRAVNSRTSDFVRSLTHREHQAMFELLPPQRAALLEQGLLDQAKTAIVVDMPTSGGKTLLAQFRILQALNQFDAKKGWVAYVAPTRALSAQITRRLRKDFEPIGVRVEQLTAAVEVDAFEEELLADNDQPFHVLVATPEKLSLVIRNKKVENRPLALVVMDEAHNLETEGRGLRIELLLATVKRDCPQANFLLLMPFVEGSESVARWLAQDINAGQAISLGTTPWKPNERIIGLYSAVPDDSQRGGWRLNFETLTATQKAMPLHGMHRVGGVKPIDVPKSEVLTKGQQKGFGLQTAAIATVMSARGTSVAVANSIRTVWKMAAKAAESLPDLDTVPSDIKLVQDFLRTEISPDFQLIAMLDKGVGVHHAGLSDDVRALMEWLAETGSLRMLCATTTIAQGINFPVSSVFLQTHKYAYGQEMSPREFWNLAGRAGRIGHDSVGVVGLAEGSSRESLIEFVSRNTGALVSRLVSLLNDLAAQGQLANLSEILWQDQWEDFRCYVAHLWAEKKNLDAVLSDSEQLLRQTFGYTSLRNDPAQREKADALLDATQAYARKLADMPEGIAELADSTGFSPEGVTKAMTGLGTLETKLTPSDWAPDSLFGEGGKIADLYGVMLKVPQLRQKLEEIGGVGFDRTRISDITRDWVNGKEIDTIAKEYFSRENDDESGTAAITDACRAIYRAIVNNGTWGVSALSRVSGIDFDSLPEAERRRINALPAMIYHGVRTEEAVLMRMNSAPRSAAENLGNLYRETVGDGDVRYSVGQARQFLKNMSDRDWQRARPDNAALSGSGYKRVWELLSGEAGE
ncbi:DEAD/DEAH box helicase [Luteithermobacter gelatinilyticus]|uniref:DEAD/DEAH box helicase n=1 Tax=Luteithermobacter gelatinilyticus TaxID=2582913 RepID=UPI0011063214|nr:DEAD/DEAH box helicase [Luteithermobacter gelatinilyticus]